MMMMMMMMMMMIYDSVSRRLPTAYFNLDRRYISGASHRKHG